VRFVLNVWLQWMHYLAVKLLRAKHLRAPPKLKNTASGTTSNIFTERECYESLVSVESLLGATLSARLTKRPKAGRKSTAAEVKGPASAGDLLQGAIAKGWTREV
jgi:serine/threonine-protein kinase haspin